MMLGLNLAAMDFASYTSNNSSNSANRYGNSLSKWGSV